MPTYSMGRVRRAARAAGAGVWVWAGMALVGCGSEPQVALRLSAPWPSELVTQSCEPSFNSLLSAELRVGGFNELDCPLEIEGRVARGSCDGIATGILRPVVLVWMHPDPFDSGSGRPMPLAYFLAFVDLEKDSLTGGQETVTVEFVNDGTDGVYITYQGVFDAVQVPPPDDAEPLDEAKAWLVEDGRTKNGVEDLPLDVDADLCRNLTEACGGTADDPLHKYNEDADLYPCDD